MADSERISIPRTYKGVAWQVKNRRWLAYLSVPQDMQAQVGTKQIHVGSFSNQIEAARAYNDAAVEIMGRRALLNVLPVEPDTDPTPPPPQEIRKACRKIRRSWPERERRRRRVGRVVVRFWDGSAAS
jgi:hypothetical protein